ncbi:hypothetical protein Q8W71_07290 [Methylobacterium sp. NEAU 140]|uniref:hypothetical protein n=1 Tax=Methylobacterium sp. NEAU 140 TaxID=3064945 RepID=UPI002732315F|nr:hypothetical protein [Methylobacterium sp. NEAU 140]MDP4022421.1 hypothetical protein [Methylobacterium sp. NEAU 140]
MASANSIDIKGLRIGLTAAADLIGKSKVWVRHLVKDGYIPEPSPDGYLATDVARGALRFREDEDRRASQTAGENRIRDLRADALALRLERESGALVSEAQAAGWEVFEEQAGQLRAGVMAVPARHVKDLALRRKLEDDLATEFGVASKRAADEASGVSPQAPNRAPRRSARSRKPKIAA